MSPILMLAFSLTPLKNTNNLEGTTQSVTRIYIVRHGESTFNVADSNGQMYISGNSLTIHMTEKGKEQAITTGKELSKKFSKGGGGEYVILSSTALRAKETARYIYEQMKDSLPTELGKSYPEFIEIGHGQWEGKPRDDKFLLEMAKWEKLSAKDKFNSVRLYSGETFCEAADRFLKGLQIVIKEYKGKTIIITSHNGAMNALMFSLMGKIDEFSEVPGSPLPLIKVENTNILLIEIPDGKPIQAALVKTLYQ